MRAACHVDSRTQRLARKNKKLGETASVQKALELGCLCSSQLADVIDSVILKESLTFSVASL